jgi:predicted nucleotidyltransferase
MTTFDCIKETLARNKSELKEKYHVKEIGVFGSYVKGKEHKSSDVDILVEFEPSASISLLDFVRLENHLSILLGVKVDLVERSALKPRIGKHVLQEVVSI